MNKATLNTVEDFIGAKKKCDRSGEGGTGQRGIGHLVESGGHSECCSTPWGAAAGPRPVCFQQFARCDGHCIPHDWVDDGWPDCLDGADEADLTVDGKVMPFQLGCVSCAGVILPAGFLCIESSGGLTRECVEQVGLGSDDRAKASNKIYSSIQRIQPNRFESAKNMFERFGD